MRTKLAAFLLLSSACVWAQAPQGPAPQGPGPEGRGRMQMRGQGTAGAITEIKDNALVIKQLNGETTTVNLSDKTEYRKERQPAKLADLKVGDTVMVRGERAGDAWNAQTVGVVSPEMVQRFAQGGGPGAGGPGGRGPGGGMMMMEGLGKEFIAGEITAIDETRLTIKRVDGEMQVIELDETSSLRRRGGVSITLPDVKVGEQAFGRGKLKDGVFVPEVLTVGEFPPQMRMLMGGQEPPKQEPAKKPEEKP